MVMVVWALLVAPLVSFIYALGRITSSVLSSLLTPAKSNLSYHALSCCVVLPGAAYAVKSVAGGPVKDVPLVSGSTGMGSSDSSSGGSGRGSSSSGADSSRDRRAGSSSDIIISKRLACNPGHVEVTIRLPPGQAGVWDVLAAIPRFRAAPVQEQNRLNRQLG